MTNFGIFLSQSSQRLRRILSSFVLVLGVLWGTRYPIQHNIVLFIQNADITNRKSDFFTFTRYVTDMGGG